MANSVFWQVQDMMSREPLGAARLVAFIPAMLDLTGQQPTVFRVTVDLTLWALNSSWLASQDLLSVSLELCEVSCLALLILRMSFICRSGFVEEIS